MVIKTLEKFARISEKERIVMTSLRKMMEINKNKIKRQAANKCRRTEVKLVVLNEEELIRQVCMRPVLYDRSLKGYRKMALRKQCWNDICKAMDSTEEECRKRWRSLRDSFAKHYKVAQRFCDAGANKQCKWVFYEQMSFLIPHLEGASCDFDKILDEFGDISEDAQSLNSEPIILNTASEELQATAQSIENIKDIKEHRELNENLQRSSTVPVKATDFAQIPIVNSHESPTMRINDNNVTTSTTFSRHHHTCRNHNTSANTVLCSETNGDNNGYLFDSDEKFLLSCAPTLRRLTHRENALARLKIQQILFDIEFEQKNI